jgi:hypothetical protein
MPQLRTLTSCWNHYGVIPRNIVYSWTAIDEAKTRMAMTFWRNEFDDFETGALELYRDRPLQLKPGQTRARSVGYHDRLDHLLLAEAGNWEIGVVLIISDDDKNGKHRIVDRETVDWRMRVASVDKPTGKFKLIRIGSAADAHRS